MGRAYAGGVAYADGASAAFANPAAMPQLQSAQALYVLTGINTRFDFADQGSTAATPGTLGVPRGYPSGTNTRSDETRIVPAVFLATPVNASRKLWFGFSAAVPFGGAHTNQRDWFGRYDNVESQLLTVDLSPSLGYRINDVVSIGGGIDLLYAKGKLVNAVPNPLQPGGPTPQTDGFGEFTGSDWSIGFNLGLFYSINPDTDLGIHYRSHSDFQLSGDATGSDFSGPLDLLNGNQNASLNLQLPDIFSLGITSNLSSRWLLLAEANWFRWERLQEIRVRTAAGDALLIPVKFRNSFGLSVGFEYQWTDNWRLRSGLRYDQTPTQDEYRSALVPDSDRTTLGLGASYHLSEKLRLDLAYQHVMFADAPMDRNIEFFDDQPLITSTVNMKAETDLVADLISIGLRHEF